MEKFGTTKSWPPGQTEQLVENGLGQGGMVSKTELHSSSVEIGETSRRTTISAALRQSGIYGKFTRWKPLNSKRRMTAFLEFAKRHLKTLSP
jgi:hypothetical protein